MTKYSKLNIIYLLQKWLDSVPGQTFMNYAYSWGASIVILGALFKLTHLPGANVMLFLGMGTEVLVFFIAGFDRPFDKTEDGKEIPTHMEGVIVGGGGMIGGSGELPEGTVVESVGEGGEYASGGVVIGGGGGGTVIGGGGTVIGGGGTVIGGGGGSVVVSGSHIGEGGTELSEEELAALAQQPSTGVSGGIIGGGVIGGGVVGGAGVPEMSELPEIDAESMEEATNNYVDQLKSLTETLQKVAEQSERLTRDSEEMENLNRTLTGISKVYEMQLKGASQQIGTIDEINDQTRKMAEQIAELNRIYARMIEAMTTNMPKAPLVP